MRRPTTRVVIVVAATAAFASVGTGLAIAGSGALERGEDAPLQSSVHQQAVDAALAHVGEGQVSDSEVSEEEGAYEVEVLLDDGTEVELQLDESFAVVAEEQETPDAD